MTIELKKVERDCPFNKNPENFKRKLYDFQTWLDGEHRATWKRGILCSHNGYSLCRIDNSQIINVNVDGERRPRSLQCGRQSELVAKTSEFLPHIPTLDEYKRDALELENKKLREQQRIAEEVRQDKIREAAPELLKQLENLVGIICSMPGFEERDVTIEDCDQAKAIVSRITRTDARIPLPSPKRKENNH